MRYPEPYRGTLCTRRDHQIPKNIKRTIGYRIPRGDRRKHACCCGLVMIANGEVEIRFGLLDYLFPPSEDGAGRG